MAEHLKIQLSQVKLWIYIVHDSHTFTCNYGLHTDIVPPDTVKPEEEEDGDETLYIAVGVSVVVVVIIIILALSVIAVERNKRMKSMLL